MAKISKRFKKAVEGVDVAKAYSVEEAVKLIKARANAKFDETIELAINLGVDPRHADQMVRGVVSLPNGTGRDLRVAVFAKGAKAEEAKKAGADIVGAEELAELVQKGTIDFDRCIATPDMMGIVGRLGKVLGPRGMMPNPKVGTVTMDVTTAIKDAKGGAVEFRVEKAGIVQAGVGKASFTEEALVQNVQAFVGSISRAKPSGAKGKYVRKIAVSSTMGPGIKIDTNLFYYDYKNLQLSAIIPVNAIPGTNQLQVWWFRPNHANNAAGFQTVYWPTIIGNYTIQWPGAAPQIIMAANVGTGTLDPAVAEGTIYGQPDPTKPGYNPNEEHAIMTGGAAYALRDDLNVTNVNPSSALPFGGYSSAPFVLINYLADDGLSPVD